MYTDPNGRFPWAAIFIGALIGTVSSGIQSDWDIGAMLAGGVIGGVAGGVGGYMGGLYNGAVGGAAAGATAGGLSSAYYGGNVMDGILKGAVIGGIGGAAFEGIGYPNSLGRVAAYTAVSGGLAELAGGDFGQGVMIGGSLAFMGYGYYKLTDIGNGGRLPKGDLSDGTAMVKDNDPKIDLPKMDANRNKSYLGEAAIKLEALNNGVHEGSPMFRWLTSHTFLLHFPANFGGWSYVTI
jgi:hypothetical protein